MLCKDGKDIWMNVSGAPLLEEDGSYAGSFAFFTNITYRKQIEQLLQKSHEEEK
jgi:PAS domain S-box-containing protein